MASSIRRQFFQFNLILRYRSSISIDCLLVPILVVSGSATLFYLGILSEEDRSTGRGRPEVVAAMSQIDNLLSFF